MPKTQAVVFTGPDAVTVREVALPECGPDQVVSETLYTFVSPGTELRVLGGYYGAAGQYPLVPGYASVGRIVEVGREVRSFRVGDLVSCRSQGAFLDAASYWGGQAGLHLDYAVSDDSPVLLPEGAEPFDYVVAEVAAISFRGAQAVRPEAGENALIIGQGMIGAMVEEFLRRAGCRTVVCDYSPERLKEALRRGASHAVDMNQPGAEERIAMLGRGGYEIVVEASGSTPGYRLACKMVRISPYRGMSFREDPCRPERTPRLLLQANYIEEVGIDPFNFIPGEAVTILMPIDRGFLDRQRTVEAIRTGGLAGGEYTGNVFSPAEMPEVYRRLQRREILSAVCKWR